MSQTIATIADVPIPDTPLVREATELVRAATNDLLFDHCRRVYFWGTLKGRARGLTADPELLYIGAMFHDLGLTETYRRTDERFEIDGADAARDFLLAHGRSPQDARTVWLAIALHTTPEVPYHLEPEIALVTAGVETDVLGFSLEELTDRQKAQVIAAHPRPDFKHRILAAFYAGMKDRPDTTFGTMNDDVLAHFDPTFKRKDFAEIILRSDWPE